MVTPVTGRNIAKSVENHCNPVQQEMINVEVHHSKNVRGIKVLDILRLYCMSLQGCMAEKNEH